MAVNLTGSLYAVTEGSTGGTFVSMKFKDLMPAQYADC